MVHFMFWASFQLFYIYLLIEGKYIYQLKFLS